MPREDEVIFKHSSFVIVPTGDRFFSSIPRSRRYSNRSCIFIFPWRGLIPSFSFFNRPGSVSFWVESVSTGSRGKEPIGLVLRVIAVVALVSPSIGSEFGGGFLLLYDLFQPFRGKRIPFHRSILSSNMEEIYIYICVCVVQVEILSRYSTCLFVLDISEYVNLFGIYKIASLMD